MKTFLCLALAVAPLSASAAPTGRLGYLKDGFAVVSNAATGRATRLPRSKGAVALAISPRGWSAYFVAQPGFGDDGPIPQDGWLAAPPYRLARKLPAGLQDETFGQLKWNAAASMLYLRGFEIQGTYSTKSDRFQKLGELPDTTSRDEKRAAFLRGEAIFLREAQTGRERLIWNRKSPQVLLSALKRAKNPARLRDLTSSLDPTLAKDASNWTTSTPALTPDGSRLFFGSNLGGGAGAAGNSMWAIFAADLKTGRIEVLSKVGAQFGRMPDTFEVSPDGKRLLVLYSAHSSAVENPYTALIIDLATQNSRELLARLEPKGADANDVDGAVWSPDGKYVAISAYFYNSAKAWKEVENPNGPADNLWTLFVQDAATGRVVRRVAGARGPSWGR